MNQWLKKILHLERKSENKKSEPVRGKKQIWMNLPPWIMIQLSQLIYSPTAEAVCALQTFIPIKWGQRFRKYKNNIQISLLNIFLSLFWDWE